MNGPANHPCFNEAASAGWGRVHLPVAPACNIRCNYCDRRCDCANENRPGVASVILSPAQAARYLAGVMSKRKNISVAGIAGPGDPFANPEATLETLKLVREKFPNLLLCVATNGLNLQPHIEELAKLNVSHVTITVNAVDPSVGAQIYAWVRYQKKIYRGPAAAAVLQRQQLESIAGLKARGVTVKINSIIIPGVNDAHIAEVAKKMAALGVDIFNCIPLCPSKETLFGHIPEPAANVVSEIRRQAGQYLKQMSHCRRCRADAAGLLAENLGGDGLAALKDAAAARIAIATREGLLINQHLGEAVEISVYQKSGQAFKLLEKRKTPERGGGIKRWLELSRGLSDCRAILASGAGHAPREILGLKGIRVIETEGLIEDALDALARGIEIDQLQNKWPVGCQAGCPGGGQGCGG